MNVIVGGGVNNNKHSQNGELLLGKYNVKSIWS